MLFQKINDKVNENGRPLFQECFESPVDGHGCYIQDDLGNFFDFRGLNGLAWYNFELIYIDDKNTKNQEYELVKWAQAENPFSLKLNEEATFWQVPGKPAVMWSMNGLDGIVHSQGFAQLKFRLIDKEF